MDERGGEGMGWKCSEGGGEVTTRRQRDGGRDGMGAETEKGLRGEGIRG